MDLKIEAISKFPQNIPSNMEQKLVERYYLQVETHKKTTSDDELLQLVLREEYWDVVTGLSANPAKLKQHFFKLDFDATEGFFRFGISCFMRFIQSNFTGPTLEESVTSLLEGEKFKDVDYATHLMVNNEEVNVNTKYPVLLVVAKIVFDCCIVHDFLNSWWSIRAIMIHQAVLDEASPTLFSNVEVLVKYLEMSELIGRHRAEMEIDLAQLYLKFRHVSKARVHIINAGTILGLQCELIGKMGKRTRYQEKELAQLAVRITLTPKEGIARPEVDDFVLPKSVELNDDVRLNHIQFSQTVEHSRLPNTEQKWLLLHVQHLLMSMPLDTLQFERFLPVLEEVLMQKSTYCVRLEALLLRAQFESAYKRTMERSLRQCEDIIGSWVTIEPPPLNRIGDVFGTGLAPHWISLSKYGDILFRLGLIKNSLDVYLKIKAWDEVIECYTALTLRHKAVEIIKQQLEVKPTSDRLMCFLGDATDDVGCYEKAWEVSKFRSHRAQKHWAQFLFNKKKYEECIPHYEKSLSINPLQVQLWFYLGFAAHQTKNWQKAATAYRRYTTLEPDRFEAWNNLAQAYLKLGNDRNAHQALLEALKCDFENWQIWENLMVVSCEISHFSDMIRAYHRILDLSGKLLNIKVLTILVHSICHDSNDSEGHGSKKYMEKARELLGRLSTIHPNSGDLWELYALLGQSSTLMLERLQRAYRGHTQSGWEKSPKICDKVLEVCDKMAEVVLTRKDFQPSDVVLSSIRLNISSALVAVKKNEFKELKEKVVHVGNQLECILERIKEGGAAAAAKPEPVVTSYV